MIHLEFPLIGALTINLSSYRLILSSFLVATYGVSNLSTSNAHSWIDCFGLDKDKLYNDAVVSKLNTIAGLQKCDGHGAGYPGRFGLMDDYQFEIPRDNVPKGVTVCDPKRQGDYSDWRKRLVAKGGDTVYYSYTPNGHISKDKTGRGTTHGIYWSLFPIIKMNSTKDISYVTLIENPVSDFDDGNCGETYEDKDKTIRSGRAGDGKPCIGKFQIPKKILAGRYYMVWFWTHYKEDGSYYDKVKAEGFRGAAYSTCFEIDVVKTDINTPFASPNTLLPVTSAPITTTPPTTKPVTSKPVTQKPVTITPSAFVPETITPSAPVSSFAGGPPISTAPPANYDDPSSSATVSPNVDYDPTVEVNNVYPSESSGSIGIIDELTGSDNSSGSSNEVSVELPTSDATINFGYLILMQLLPISLVSTVILL